jgi:glycosyltransferase involved in cell wall biosynthesis
MEFYQDMAKELGIENYCIFYGQCDRQKVFSIMNQMDFSISASIFESAGVSVQEAMLLGKPLVVTKSGGANSLVTEDSAIVVDRESTEALVNGIKEMSNRLPEFDTEKIRKYALANFEINQVSKKYMELYTSLLR